MSAQLQIYTLGGLQIAIDGNIVTGFDSKRVSALLVYLAVTGHGHPREVLAEMFWEDRSLERALGNFRVMLSSLRKTVGDYVIITRQDVGMHPDSNYWLDAAFLGSEIGLLTGYDDADLSSDHLQRIEDALDLYNGDFLKGFYVDSDTFEEWVRQERSSLEVRVGGALDRFITILVQLGMYERAYKYATRLLQIDDVSDLPYQHIMRVLALMGQRNAAIEYYHQFARKITPMAETVALYEQIRQGELLPPVPASIVTKPSNGAYHYNILEEIGKGGIGRVYRGEDTQSGRIVAIKMLREDVITNNPEMLERFKREGDALKQLAHPNIVHYHEMFEHDGQHQIIMEFVEGGSLQDLIDDVGPLPIEHILDIALGVADALTRAHRLNILHRDIKPANILLGDDGEPRLTDFGLAYVEGSGLTEAGSIVGTIEYIAPEILMDEPWSVQADIWSFGLTLCQTLINKHPFQRKNMSAMVNSILNEDLPDLEELRDDAPLALIDLIYRMLEKDRDKRIPSMRIVGVEIEALLQGRSGVWAKQSAYDGDLAQPFQSSFDMPKAVLQTLGHNLPEQLTPFVGRQQSLQLLHDMVSSNDTRLITIAGPGGIGKSRLALEFAWQHLDDYRDGAFFVSLAGLHTSENLVTEIARTLYIELTEDVDDERYVVEWLATRDLLLILDNFETVLAATPVITHILQNAPNVQLLVTTREKLRHSGEHVLELGAMDYPRAQRIPEDDVDVILAKYDALQLFVEAARRARYEFHLEPEDVPVVVDICQQLYGMPLAIVLAAAWVELLSIADIAHELKQSIAFLDVDIQDIPERHRSLRAVFETSWKQLKPETQAILARLAVFNGGFERDAAQTIAGASLRALMTLVSKSLVYRDAETGRYLLHGLLRQFAYEKLETDAQMSATTHLAHARYYIAFIAHREAQIRAAQLSDVLPEMDNIRQAWDYALEHGHIQLMGEALTALVWIYEIQGFMTEALYVFSNAEQRLSVEQMQPEHEIVFGRVLGILGAYVGRSDSLEEGYELVRRGIAILEARGARTELAMTKRLLSHVARTEEELHDAYQQIVDSIDDLKGNPAEHKSAMIDAAEIAEKLNDYTQAYHHAEDALNVLGGENERLEARARIILGELDSRRGELEAALRKLEASLQQYQAIHFSPGVASTLRKVARVYMEMGELEAAREHYYEALATEVELSQLKAGILVDICELMLKTGEHQQALKLFAVGMQQNRQRDLQDTLRELEQHLNEIVGEHAVQQALQAARTTSLNTMIDELLSQM